MYLPSSLTLSSFFFFNDTATTEIYTLSLHDALPISWRRPDAAIAPAPAPAQRRPGPPCAGPAIAASGRRHGPRRRHRAAAADRSEEHTSELQSQSNLVCRLLLEKKKRTGGVCVRVSTVSLPH